MKKLGLSQYHKCANDPNYGTRPCSVKARKLAGLPPNNFSGKIKAETMTNIKKASSRKKASSQKKVSKKKPQKASKSLADIAEPGQAKRDEMLALESRLQRDMRRAGEFNQFERMIRQREGVRIPRTERDKKRVRLGRRIRGDNY